MRYPASFIEQALTVERKMAFIAGPRQVGKTTLAKSLVKPDTSGAYFNWDLESHRKRLQKKPDHFWDAREDGAPARVILDEIHKYPRWKGFLKGLFDTKGSELELIVTGSGRLDVYQKGGDSLLGRYALSRLHPFTVGELVANGRQTISTVKEFDEQIVEPHRKAGASGALDQIMELTGFPNRCFPEAPIA